ncbi:SLAIN motif-containing protein-like [Odontesthes bonariensis]|uniref:SLAIN motif-containing protein-like n=1 Tax=Odontesthes bonariensis TaxID=219752 RepID=UPI003F58BD85
MELQNNMMISGEQYFCYQPQVEFDTGINHHLLSRELKSSCEQLEGRPDPHCNVWTDSEPARINCNGKSFAMDARIRLDSLKSGCDIPLPCCAIDSTLYSCNGEKDHSEQSALDLVEILDIEDDMQDEESCFPHRLYEPQKEQSFVEKESAFIWCRHILDNPSPEMEAACRALTKKLDQTSRSHFYRHAAPSHYGPSLGSSVDKTSVSTSLSDSDTSDHELSVPGNSITSSYRLQDITDVHIIAKMQEASLRQNYGSAPATASEMLPSYSNATLVNVDEFAAGNKNKTSSSSYWQPALSSQSSSCCQSATKQGRQGPKLTRLHQQVTQFKLLKLAQNQATAEGRTRSPLRTSLRSLQAVRNSRSLENDDCQAVDQPSYPLTASLNSSRLTHLMKDSSVRMTAVKKLQRSQSLSPSRIPHPARGYLSVRGRVFASPERPTTAAWGRCVISTQR